ncbi:hypothetical protein ACFWNN_02985 [Lentzea sp. NPDC058450]
MSTNSRKPRRPSRIALVLQGGIVAVQLCILVAELVDAITRLLDGLW